MSLPFFSWSKLVTDPNNATLPGQVPQTPNADRSSGDLWLDNRQQNSIDSVSFDRSGSFSTDQRLSRSSLTDRPYDLLSSLVTGQDATKQNASTVSLGTPSTPSLQDLFQQKQRSTYSNSNLSDNQDIHQKTSTPPLLKTVFGSVKKAINTFFGQQRASSVADSSSTPLPSLNKRPRIESTTAEDVAKVRQEQLISPLIIEAPQLPESTGLVSSFAPPLLSQPLYPPPLLPSHGDMSKYIQEAAKKAEEAKRLCTYRYLAQFFAAKQGALLTLSEYRHLTSIFLDIVGSAKTAMIDEETENGELAAIGALIEQHLGADAVNTFSESKTSRYRPFRGVPSKRTSRAIESKKATDYASSNTFCGLEMYSDDEEFGEVEPEGGAMVRRIVVPKGRNRASLKMSKFPPQPQTLALLEAIEPHPASPKKKEEKKDTTQKVISPSKPFPIMLTQKFDLDKTNVSVSLLPPPEPKLGNLVTQEDIKLLAEGKKVEMPKVEAKREELKTEERERKPLFSFNAPLTNQDSGSILSSNQPANQEVEKTAKPVFNLSSLASQGQSQSSSLPTAPMFQFGKGSAEPVEEKKEAEGMFKQEKPLFSFDSLKTASDTKTLFSNQPPTQTSAQIPLFSFSLPNKDSTTTIKKTFNFETPATGVAPIAPPTIPKFQFSFDNAAQQQPLLYQKEKDATIIELPSEVETKKKQEIADTGNENNGKEEIESAGTKQWSIKDDNKPPSLIAPTFNIGGSNTEATDTSTTPAPSVFNFNSSITKPSFSFGSNNVDANVTTAFTTPSKPSPSSANPPLFSFLGAGGTSQFSFGKKDEVQTLQLQPQATNDQSKELGGPISVTKDANSVLPPTNANPLFPTSLNTTALFGQQSLQSGASATSPFQLGGSVGATKAPLPFGQQAIQTQIFNNIGAQSTNQASQPSPFASIFPLATNNANILQPFANLNQQQQSLQLSQHPSSDASSQGSNTSQIQARRRVVPRAMRKQLQ